MNKNMVRAIFCGLCLYVLAATDATLAAELTAQSKAASVYTEQSNKAVYSKLDFADQKEFEFAKRDLIEATDDLEIFDKEGNVVWSVKNFAFVKEEAPATANPSLWRNTRLNAQAGLFEVCDGIYQVRGYDMANATYIRSDNGWIVLDPLMCKEDMQAAHALVKKNLFDKYEKNDIVAVIYSHPHIDHYGGIEGLIDKRNVANANIGLEQQLASGKTAILAPQGFLEHAVSENIYAGKAMSRRAQYQYGPLLAKGAQGGLAMGIALGQATGTVSLVAPTYEVSKTMQQLDIDGVKMEFQLTPGTEAPCEMNIWLPEKKALWLAENCTGTLHNLYTLRGAQVRDAEAWVGYLCETITSFGGAVEVAFQSHNWPHWGNADINEYMQNHAAIYKFIHDQTLHYINQGYTATEIANMLTLPAQMEKVWYTRQYYGTLSHNIKAVYQKYMGWYDANPVNLNLLPPEASAKKLVQYLGDSKRVLKMAQADFAKGEYQWVAQITKELIFADPTNKQARLLCADALEQLGYQAESGTWRNAYLTAALELRKGNQAIQAVSAKGGASTYGAMSVEMLLGYVGIISDSKAAEQDDLSIYLDIVDTGEKFLVKRTNGVLLCFKNATDNGKQDATVRGSRSALIAALLGKQTQLVEIVGDQDCINRLMKYANPGTNTFNIIEP